MNILEKIGLASMIVAISVGPIGDNGIAPLIALCGGWALFVFGDVMLESMLSEKFIAFSHITVADEISQQNKQLREALQALFDECVIADIAGELSDAVTGETLDKVREVLKSGQEEE